MKRIFILLFFLLISLLNASFIIDAYHRDYGVINRTVLVFDTKPEYEILKHESDIQINLQGCRKDASLQKMNISNSKVLKGFDYITSEDKVVVMININTSQLLVTGEKYKVEGMELQGDVFKLVLDIFISSNPQSLSELTSYASFYKTTGNLELANEYNNMVIKVHNTIKAQQENVDNQLPETITLKKSTMVTTKFKSTFQNFISILNTKIIGFILLAIVLFIVVIFLIYKLTHKKASALDKDKSSLRPIDGFADREYLEEVAKKLEAKNWKVEEIAKELEITFEEAQKIIAPDLELEMERL